MLQTSTTDSEFNLFPVEEVGISDVALCSEDLMFYDSIKNELNKISFTPPQQAVDKVLKYSKSIKTS